MIKMDTRLMCACSFCLFGMDVLKTVLGAGEPTERNAPTEKLWVDYDDVTEEPFSMEYVVSDPIRVWHVGAIILTSITIIIVILCCIFDCRIPRSKEEIEKNHERRQLAFKYADQLTKLHVPEIKIVTDSAAGSSKDSNKGDRQKERRSGTEGKDREVQGHREKGHRHDEEVERPKRKRRHRRKSVVADSATPLARHPTDVMKPSKKAQLALGVPNEKATARTLAKINSKEGHPRSKNPKV